MTEVQGSNRMKNVLLTDSSACIGCGGCEAACALEHDLPDGVSRMKVIPYGPFQRGLRLEMSFLPVTCFHCDRPACVSECPTGAMQKRPDGIVFSDPDLCIGCQTCAIACPYGIPILNSATGKITKCDGCRERIDLGLWPACAIKCPAAALAFGRVDRVVQDRRQREAMKIVAAFAPLQEREHAQIDR